MAERAFDQSPNMTAQGLYHGIPHPEPWDQRTSEQPPSLARTIRALSHRACALFNYSSGRHLILLRNPFSAYWVPPSLLVV
jgi:hypothetical protein